MFKPNHRHYLKVKIKSLAEESRIIRKEELKTSGELREGLYQHRIWDVRGEARAALMAYAYLRGKSVESVEPNAHQDYLASRAFNRAKQIVKKFGNEEAQDGFRNWATKPRDTMGVAQ